MPERVENEIVYAPMTHHGDSPKRRRSTESRNKYKDFELTVEKRGLIGKSKPGISEDQRRRREGLKELGKSK